MSAYEALAESYDRLTNDVQYKAIFRYVQKLLKRNGKKPKRVLDLACGTGSLSMLFADKGYEVLGLDASEEMLTVAAAKAAEAELNPLFIQGWMQRFRLPAPVDLVVCGLDSMNYLTKPTQFKKTLENAFRALNPGGMFIFDLITPDKFRTLDGQVFLDEDDDVYCVWRAEFNEKNHIMCYGMDIFQRHGNAWSRSYEEHQEYAYELNDVLVWLTEAGFKNIELFGDRTLEAPSEGAQRVYFAACKE